MKPKAITDQDFKAEVLESNLLTLVCFRADWSYASHLVDLSLQAVSSQHDGAVRIVTMDINQCSSTARELGVPRVPYILYYFKGSEQMRDEGFRTSRFIEWRIQEILNRIEQGIWTRDSRKQPSQLSLSVNDH